VDTAATAPFHLQLVGGGRMGEALLRGLLASGQVSVDQVVVVEADEGRRKELADLIPGLAVVAEPRAAISTVVAVKPPDVQAVCAAVADAGSERLLSIAAGVTLAAIEAGSAGVRVVRAMPNTPALVGVGASAIAGGVTATADDLQWAEDVLGAVGVVVRVTEEQLDAVTGLSGSGPAYVFLLVESLVEAGVLSGLPREVSETLVRQTLLGSARLLLESGDDAATLRAGVTSPGGTTAAGLGVLERAGTRAAILDAVAAATARSRELGAG
jgi:pyrroline-5-carboxylate reductase